VKRVLIVWITLVALAALTVATAYIPLGAANMVINIAIAAAKALLIAVFFMHLAQPYVVPRMICIIAAAMLVVMFSLSGVDYYTRGAPTVKVDAPRAGPQ
jgi:cytochrome c oxidase subunit 4